MSNRNTLPEDLIKPTILDEINALTSSEVVTLKIGALAFSLCTLVGLPIAKISGDQVALKASDQRQEKLSELAEASTGTFIPVRLDPTDSFRGFCSGGIVGETLFTARHCFFTEVGDGGSLVDRTFSVLDESKKVLFEVTSASFTVSDSEFAYRDSENRPCTRSPVVGENVWTIHWPGNRGYPVVSDLLIASKIQGEEGRTAELNGSFFVNIQNGAPLLSGSSGAVVMAKSDHCVVGVVSGFLAKPFDALGELIPRVSAISSDADPLKYFIAPPSGIALSAETGRTF